MTFFKHWTKKQMARGIVGTVLLVLSVLVYTFISDYEAAKSETLDQATQQIEELRVDHLQQAQNTQSRIDEQLLQSSEEDVLKQDAQFRKDYSAFQVAIVDLVTGAESDTYTDEAKQALTDIGVSSSSLVSAYVPNNDLSSGLLYFIEQPTNVFEFTYTDGVIDTLTHVNTLDTQEIQVENE